MERITRDTIALFEELKKDLKSISIGDKERLIFTFCQIGQILNHAFSISYIKGEKNYFKCKVWDTTMYTEGNRLGYFNLDRLAIREKDFEISIDEYIKITSHLKEEFSTNDRTGITLDGLFCELSYAHKTFIWNTDREMNEALEVLISFLREKIDSVYYNVP